MTKTELDHVLTHLEAVLDEYFATKWFLGKAWKGVEKHVLSPDVRSKLEDRLVAMGIITADAPVGILPPPDDQTTAYVPPAGPGEVKLSPNAEFVAGNEVQP